MPYQLRPAVPVGPGNQPVATPLVLPHLVTDPVASLTIWPVTIQLGGHELELPAAPASTWLTVLMSDQPDLDDILPGLLAQEDAELVEELLVAEQVSLGELYDLALEVIAAACGRAWWVALRLIATARGHWDRIGAEVLQRAPANKISIAAWLDIVFSIILERLEDSSRQMWLLQLEQPPPGAVPSDTGEQGMTASEFLALAQPD